MSLYRTLSQLPNDLPLILGAKVDRNAAKAQPAEPRPDPLDAWFTPIVREVKAKVGAKKAAPPKPPKLTTDAFVSHRAAVAESKADDANVARARVREMATEALAILGRPAMLRILDGYGAKRLIDLDPCVFGAFIQEMREHIVIRLDIGRADNTITPYNRPDWV